MEKTVEELKQEFTKVFTENIKREGADKLLDYLTNSSDFFTAPASGRRHSSYEGGLVAHSLNVFNRFKKKIIMEYGEDYANIITDESIAIIALLHDLCKAEFYKLGSRNVKNEQTGQWEKVPFYSIEDKFPFGHGEKSVFLIERFMRLKVDEAIAIRWHMGGFDDAARGGSFAINNAFEKYPLLVKLHIADIEATYLMENTPH